MEATLSVFPRSSSSNNEIFSANDISEFCKGTNAFWKQLVIQPVREYVEVQPAGTARSDVLSKLISKPEVPGLSRPEGLTILGSVPTALGWYGYYKFSAEEELFQYELQETGTVNDVGATECSFPLSMASWLDFH
jgi:hypothetical protein